MLDRSNDFDPADGSQGRRSAIAVHADERGESTIVRLSSDGEEPIEGRSLRDRADPRYHETVIDRPADTTRGAPPPSRACALYIILA